jgi:predicted nucleic acid-binding protein
LIGLPRAVASLERLSPNGLAVSIVSLGELYEGAFGSIDPAARLVRYREFLSPFPVLPLTDPIMEHFGKMRAELRLQGNLILDFDLLIAATAIDHSLILLTRNRRHFERIPGLDLYSSSSQTPPCFGLDTSTSGGGACAESGEALTFPLTFLISMGHLF